MLGILSRWRLRSEAPAEEQVVHSPPRITLVLGDIVEQDVDAIVNAADWTMLGGTGVDGAIREAAGPEMSAACLKVGRLRTAQAVATSAFKLKARHVIHTVAPVHEENVPPNVKALNEELLRLSYQNCLDLASRMGLRSIAFPALGGGAFGWFASEVAEAAAYAARRIAAAPNGLTEVRFVAFGRKSFRCHQDALGLEGVIERDPASLRYHPGTSALG